MQSLRALPRATSAIRAFSTSTPRPLAKMHLIGRLADVPELTPTSTGREITKLSLGVSSGLKDENGVRPTSWFRIASFVEGPQRDLLLSLPKGTQLYVEAEARMDQYQDREGQPRTGLNLVMRNFEALQRPQSSREGSSQGTTGVESDANAAEEPMSGIGQS